MSPSVAHVRSPLSSARNYGRSEKKGSHDDDYYLLCCTYYNPNSKSVSHSRTMGSPKKFFLVCSKQHQLSICIKSTDAAQTRSGRGILLYGFVPRPRPDPPVYCTPYRKEAIGSHCDIGGTLQPGKMGKSSNRTRKRSVSRMCRLRYLFLRLR